MTLIRRLPGRDWLRQVLSILGVISLGIDHGDEVILAADGEGADEALDALEALLLEDHDA